jgi:hypothetical protein
VNVFDLDRALVDDYERFARSFTLIRAPDIREQVEALYASDRFWPEPLISINPRFERGASIDQADLYKIIPYFLPHFWSREVPGEDSGGAACGLSGRR